MEHTELTARECAYIEGRDEERLEELAGRIRERDREDQQLANLMLAHAVEPEFCEYILATGHRRPCPAGPGCTARKEGGRKRRRTEE